MQLSVVITIIRKPRFSCRPKGLLTFRVAALMFPDWIFTGMTPMISQPSYVQFIKNMKDGFHLF